MLFAIIFKSYYTGICAHSLYSGDVGMLGRDYYIAETQTLDYYIFLFAKTTFVNFFFTALKSKLYYMVRKAILQDTKIERR